MKYAIAMAVIVTATVAAQAIPSPPQGRGRGGSPPPMPAPLAMDDHAGFESIFDGSSMKGWDGDPAFWRAANGALTGQSSYRDAIAFGALFVILLVRPGGLLGARAAREA